MKTAWCTAMVVGIRQKRMQAGKKRGFGVVNKLMMMACMGERRNSNWARGEGRKPCKLVKMM